MESVQTDYITIIMQTTNVGRMNILKSWSFDSAKVDACFIHIICDNESGCVYIHTCARVM